MDIRRRKLDKLLFEISVGKDIEKNGRLLLDHYDEMLVTPQFVNITLKNKKVCCWVGLLDNLRKGGIGGLSESKIYFHLVQWEASFFGTMLPQAKLILETLQGDGIYFKPVKGCGDQFEGGFNIRRKFGDIDLIVQKPQLVASKSRLLSEGFRLLSHKLEHEYLFEKRVDSAIVKLEVSVDTYGVFPKDHPFILVTVAPGDPGKERMALIHEEWLADGLVAPQEVNDISRLCKKYYGGNYHKLISDIDLPAFKCITAELINQFIDPNVKVLGFSLFHTYLARLFIGLRGRKPFLGAHILRFLVFHHRMARHRNKVAGVHEFAKFIFRYYLGKRIQKLPVKFRNLLAPDYGDHLSKPPLQPAFPPFR